MDQIQLRKRAIHMLNVLLKERVRQQEDICKRLPQFAHEGVMDDGTPILGGLKEDLNILRYALQPEPSQPGKTLLDQLDIPTEWQRPIFGTSTNPSNVFITDVQLVAPADPA
ncbi:MAG TPA: hypothetical protein VNL17_14360 [Verrucomicrobiae bacterium]|nr:hypothetical protein [Verrucomicrobiae bacterium]